MRTDGWPEWVAVASATACGSGFTFSSARSYQRANSEIGSLSTFFSLNVWRISGTRGIVPRNDGSDLRSTAGADGAARGAELAAVLVDYGRVAAFLAFLSVQDTVARGARFHAVVFGDFEHAHLVHGVAALVEHAEHSVAVDDEASAIGEGAGKILLPLLSRHARHEVAKGLSVVEQFPQLHADPRRVNHAHVEREQLAEPVERSRVFARHPNRVWAALLARQLQLLQDQHEIVACPRVVDVGRPRHRAGRPGLGLFSGKQGIEHGGPAVRLRQCAQLIHAVANDTCESRDHARHALNFPFGRHRAVEGVVARGASQDL